jgi:hypothetical protein
MWPAVIVQQLFPRLPEGFVAVPGVHLGTAFEIDVSVNERNGSNPEPMEGDSDSAVAVCAPPKPTLTLEAEFPDYDEYEVRIYDERYEQRLVAAIELVSPANKDRPHSREAFVAKVAALLRRDVCVSLVDVVTIRQFNLYADLLDLMDARDPAFGTEPPYLYGVTIRSRKRPRGRSLVETWFHPIALGQALPSLPVWLDVDLNIQLELESSYEETCRFLRIS